jgi:hypothetical protein
MRDTTAPSGRDAVLVAGSFMAVRCGRPVQGGVIKSARTRPRPKAVRPIGDFAAAKPTFKLAN